MDVGDPGIFIRILEIFHQQLNDLQKTLNGFTISDDETKAALISVFKNHNYLRYPLGVVAYTAWKQYQTQHPKKGVIQETAHPGKFYDVNEPLINQKLTVPEK